MDNHKNNHPFAFVFPGQGSQTVGMLSALAYVHPIVRETFEQASDTLDFDLWKLVQHGFADDLNQTHHTQPAMLAAGIAVWRLWCQQSTLRPVWVAGHSLGEYSALVCAEAIAFEDTLKIVVERGHLMQNAVPLGTGAMAAILGLDDEQVTHLCSQVAENEILSAVNFNAPNQVVIAGHTTAVDRALIVAKELGAKLTKKLPVSVPSHCILMKAAAEKLKIKLQKISIVTPKISLIHNVDINSYTDAKMISNALTEQLFNPIRWVESIEFIHNQGINTFVEMGPGKVLMGLNKRIVKAAKHLAIHDPKSLDQVLEQLDG